MDPRKDPDPYLRCTGWDLPPRGPAGQGRHGRLAWGLLHTAQAGGFPPHTLTLRVPASGMGFSAAAFPGWLPVIQLGSFPIMSLGHIHKGAQRPCLSA